MILDRFTIIVAATLTALATITSFAADGEIIDPLKRNIGTLQRLEANKTDQLNRISKNPVFHQFTFRDAYSSSGIQFRHRAVDDAAKNWKPAHYDHGSALAVADVDGDSRLDIYFVNQLGRNELWKKPRRR